MDDATGDGGTAAKDLLAGLTAALKCGRFHLQDAICSGTSTTRGHLRNALSLPFSSADEDVEEPGKRLLRLWRSTLSLSEKEQVKNLELGSPPEISTEGDDSEFNIVGLDDVLNYNHVDVEPELGPVIARVYGSRGQLHGRATTMFLWAGQPETLVLKRATKSIRTALHAQASEDDPDDDFLEHLRTTLLGVEGVSSVKNVVVTKSAAVSRHTPGQQAEWVSVLTCTTFSAELQSSGDKWLPIVIDSTSAEGVSELKPIIIVPASRNPEIFPLYKLPLYSWVGKNTKPYWFGYSTLPYENDTPFRHSPRFDFFVEKWERVMARFQEITGITNREDSCVLLFYSKERNKCIRFCRLTNFFHHYLASHRPRQTLSSAEAVADWIVRNCPAYQMTKAQAVSQADSGMRIAQYWNDDVNGTALRQAVEATAAIADVTWQEVAHAYIDVTNVAGDDYAHPVIGIRKRAKEQPMLQFVDGLYLLGASKARPWWDRTRFVYALDSNRKRIENHLREWVEGEHRPKANWDKVKDRARGVAVLNEIAASPDPMWTQLALPQNDFLAWRAALLSPSWADTYVPNQAELLASYRAKARDLLKHYRPPSDSSLRTLIDALTAAQAAEAAGRVTAAHKVWDPEELIAVALALWIYRVPPRFDEAGERAQLSYGTTYAIQRLLPHRTTATIQNQLFKRYEQIAEVYETIVGMVHAQGLDAFADSLDANSIRLLREAGVEEEARRLMADDSSSGDEDDA